MLSNNITTACEDIGILHSESSKPTVSFADQCKYILTEASLIAGKIGHSKMNGDRTIKIISNDTILFRNQIK